MRLVSRIALLAAVVAVLSDPALAQFAPSPDTKVDLSPIINPIIQVFGALIMFLGLPLMWAWVGKMLKSWGIEATNELNATRAVVDGIAQKAIGGAITRYSVVPGQVTVDVKDAIVADAVNSLVTNGGESLAKLGVKDNEKIVKAREIIESRLGLMAAASAGAPVPNPSQPAVHVAPVAVPIPVPVPTNGAQ